MLVCADLKILRSRREENLMLIYPELLAGSLFYYEN